MELRKSSGNKKKGHIKLLNYDWLCFKNCWIFVEIAKTLEGKGRNKLSQQVQYELMKVGAFEKGKEQIYGRCFQLEKNCDILYPFKRYSKLYEWHCIFNINI